MPANDRVRLHDDQRRAPVPPNSRESHPKESVACPQAASRRSVEGRQLLPQREVFQNRSRWPRSANVSARTTTISSSNMLWIVAGVGAKFNSDEFGEGQLRANRYPTCPA